MTILFTLIDNVDASGDPSQVAFDADGNAYVSYVNGLRGIRKYGPDWSFIAQINETPSIFPNPRQTLGVAYNPVYDRIYAIRGANKLVSMATDGSGVVSSELGETINYRNLQVAPDGESLFICDWSNLSVRQTSLAGNIIRTFQMPVGSFNYGCYGCWITPDWTLYAGAAKNGVVHVWESTDAATGSYVSPDRSFGEFGSGVGQLNQPFGVAVLQGLVYVADRERRRVLAFTDAGEFVDEGELGLSNPRPLSLTPTPLGDIVVCDSTPDVQYWFAAGQSGNSELWAFDGPSLPDGESLCVSVPLPDAAPGEVTMIVAALDGTATLEADCTCACDDICPAQPIAVEEVPPDNLTDPEADETCAVDPPVVEEVEALSLFERTFQQAGMAEGGWYIYAQQPFPNGNVSHNEPPQDAYDFLVPLGTPIYAPLGGTVVYWGCEAEQRDQIGGWAVIVQATDGTTLYYGHIDEVYVELGDTVAEEQMIATVGLTGMGDPAVNVYASPHLHFQAGLSYLYESPVTIDAFLDSIGFTLPPFVGWPEIRDNFLNDSGPTYR